MRKPMLFALLLLALPIPAVAQQESALAMTVQNVTAEAEAAAGNPRTDEQARPSDVLRYRITFTNRTDAPVRDVVLADDIPQALQLIGGSARSSGEDVQVEYSADGGTTWSAEPMEEVTVDGRRVRRPIPPERFTNVRWTIRGSVQPRATVTAEYDTRFRLADSAQ